MSLCALPRELVHEVSTYLHCLDRYNLVLALHAQQMAYNPVTLLNINIPSDASRSEQIKLATQWKRDQVIDQLGLNPQQFYSKNHHHCIRCNSLLKMLILHYSVGTKDIVIHKVLMIAAVYRIRVATERLHSTEPRWRNEVRNWQRDTKAMFGEYLHFSYSAPGYGCGGYFERVDVIKSPLPTELHKVCDKCHLKAHIAVPNTCRLCERDYGVLPCSCRARVCIMCLQDNYQRTALAPLCHSCFSVTCAMCAVQCSSPGCQKWLCVTCKDTPQHNCNVEETRKPPVAATAPVSEVPESEVDEEVDLDGLFGE